MAYESPSLGKKLVIQNKEIGKDGKFLLCHPYSQVDFRPPSMVYLEPLMLFRLVCTSMFFITNTLRKAHQAFI